MKKVEQARADVDKALADEYARPSNSKALANQRLFEDLNRMEQALGLPLSAIGNFRLTRT